jgi:hypothetical protein
MNVELDEELEQFIRDWHHDDRSHKIAQQMGRLFFDFADSLENEKLSRATVRKYLDNCWAIGYLECQYGNRSKFSINIFQDGGALHDFEFSRKFSDSDYAMMSYASTWRKLARFVKTYDPSKIQQLR